MINILLLLIYDENDVNDEYKEMLKIQRMYVHTHKNIDAYFVMYRENQEEEVLVENDFIYVRGKEGHLQILNKTLVAMEYLTNIKHYDYIIRTNISTIFKLTEVYGFLLNELDRTEIYTGGNCFVLFTYRNANVGITDETNKYYKIMGCPFVQGTCILLSNDVVKYMIDHKDKFIYEVVDDVSIGLFMRSFMNHIHEKLNTTKRIQINTNCYYPGSVIRNKTDDSRETDVINMREYVNTYLTGITGITGIN